MNSKRIMFYITAFLIIALLAFGGCGGGGDGGKGGSSNDNGNDEVETQFIKIGEEHVFLDNETFNPNIRHIANENVVSIVYGDEQDADKAIAPDEIVLSGGSFNKGDILLMPPSAYSKYGFSGVIEKVQEGPNGTKKYLLRQALVEDILIDGDLFFSLNSTLDELLEAGNMHSLSANSPIDSIWEIIYGNQPLKFDVSKTTILPPLTFGFGNDFKALKDIFQGKVSVSGNVSAMFSATLNHSFVHILKIEDSKLRKFGMLYPYAIDTKTGVKYSGKINWKLLEEKIGNNVTLAMGTFPIGPAIIPWELRIDAVKVDVDVNVNGNASFTYNKIVYEGSISAIWDDENGFKANFAEPKVTRFPDTETPVLDASGNIEISAGPSVVFAIGKDFKVKDLSLKVASLKPSVGIKFQAKTNTNKLICYEIDLIAKLVGTINLLNLINEIPFRKNPEDRLDFSYDFKNFKCNLLNTCNTADISTPNITINPQNQSVNRGTTATFSVAATGAAPMNYQWQMKYSSKNEWTDVGANSSTYSVNATDELNSSQYRVKVSNNFGNVTSNIATLTVTIPGTGPTITNHPQNQKVSRGSNAVFSVTATGAAPLSYQWQTRYSSIGIWANVGTNSSTHSTTATDAIDSSQYRVIVSNTVGSVISNIATLTVTAPGTAPAITSHPQNQKVSRGANAVFSVTATGTAPLKYQWERRLSSTLPWSNVGTNSSTHSVTATDAVDSSQYRVTVSNAVGSIISSTATLTVTTPDTVPTSVTISPKPVTIEIGKWQQLTATVLPSNATDKTVTWTSNSKVATVSSSGVVSGSEVGTATITAKTNSGARTDTCIVTVKTAGIQPTSVTIAPNPVTIEIGKWQQLTVTVLPSNATDKTVTWTSNSRAATVSSSGIVSGSEAGTATITVKTNTGAKTDTCIVTVKNAANMTSHPKDQSDFWGSLETFSEAATGTAPINYQWERRLSITVPWNNVGTNSAAHSVTATDAVDSSQYQVAVSNAVGSVTPNTAALMAR
jgi:uncharacterized protein YjdB